MARNSASTGPLPTADACQRCCPLSMTTEPRLWMFDPEAQLQRTRRSRWSSASVGPVSLGDVAVASVMVSIPPSGRVGRSQRGGFGGREVALVTAPKFGARFPDGVFDGVGQGLRRGRDDVRIAA